MGNSDSSAILINIQPNNLFYFTGETVSGTVNLNITVEKLEVDEIYIMLMGETCYTTTHTNSEGREAASTEYHHVPFYSAKAIFVQPQSGDKGLIFNQGQYSWSFQIPLTDYLPPSINQPQCYPHVRYYLKVIIDKPWYKPNLKENRYIRVYPHVNLLQNPQCLLSTTFENHNRNEIKLKGTLNKAGYVPGEAIQFTLEIENQRNVLIKNIDLSMLQRYKIGENTQGTTIFRVTLPRILNLKDQQIRETFSILIPPEQFPPSYQFQGGIKRPAFVNNRYFLKFEVKVEGILANFNVDIPITLGTEPEPDSNQQQAFNPLTVSYPLDPESSMSHNDDSPPSYDSAIENIK